MLLLFYFSLILDIRKCQNSSSYKVRSCQLSIRPTFIVAMAVCEVVPAIRLRLLWDTSLAAKALAGREEALMSGNCAFGQI